MLKLTKGLKKFCQVICVLFFYQAHGAVQCSDALEKSTLADNWLAAAKNLAALDYALTNDLSYQNNPSLKFQIAQKYLTDFTELLKLGGPNAIYKYLEIKSELELHVSKKKTIIKTPTRPEDILPVNPKIAPRPKYVRDLISEINPFNRVQSKDGNTIYSITDDKFLIKYNLAENIETTTNLKFRRSPLYIRISPDGKSILAVYAGNREFELYSLATESVINRFGDAFGNQLVSNVEFSGDSKYLMTSFKNQRSLSIYDSVKINSEPRLFPHESDVLEVLASPNGKLVITKTDKFLRIFDIASGTELFKQETKDKDYFYTLAISPDGNLLFVGHAEYGEFVNLKADSPTISHQLPSQIKYSLPRLSLFSYDNKYFINLGYDGNVKIYNAETGEHIASIDDQKDAVSMFIDSNNYYLYLIGSGIHIFNLGTKFETLDSPKRSR